MLKKLILQILVAIFGLWLGLKVVPGVKFEGSIKIFLFCGLTLGLINFFVKPFLKKITFLLRILTLGLFNFVINMAILWFVDDLFPELTISGIPALFWVSLIISLSNSFFTLFIKK